MASLEAGGGKHFEKGVLNCVIVAKRLRKMSPMPRPLDLLDGGIGALDKWGLGRVGSKVGLKWVEERM